MSHILWLTGPLLFIALPALAADKVDPALCRNLVAAPTDPGVAYQPGVDVYGKKVAPADVSGGQQFKVPDQIKIPLTVNLAQSMGVNTSGYPYNQLGAGTEGVIGMITLQGNHVLLNGQPLTDVQQAQLAKLCGQSE